MKRLFIFLLFLIPVLSFSQVYTNDPLYGTIRNRNVFKYLLGIPKDTILPTGTYFGVTLDQWPHIAAIGDSLYLWSIAQHKWIIFSGGGGGGANNYSTSISFSNNTLTITRNGLSAISGSWDSTLYHSMAYYDGRYASKVHGHTIADISDFYTTGRSTLYSSGAGINIDPVTGIITWTGAAAGITSLNTLTGSSQTFAIGTSGTDFGISSAGSTHTFNIPTASASNRGLLSSANWSTFNSKIGPADTIGKWVGQVYKRIDSVFYKKGGTEIFAFKDSSGGGASTVNTRYSVIKGTADSLQFVNDTTFAGLNATPLAYQILSGRRGYYPVKADTADIFGIDSSLSFNNVSELRSTQLYNKGARYATTAGYTSRNDGGGSTYTWNASSTAADDSKFVFKPTAISSGSPGRWELQTKGVVRASEVGVKSDGTDQTSTLNSLFSLSSVKEVVFDNGDVTVSSTVSMKNKKVSFFNNARIIGSGTIDSANVKCDYQTQCFGTSLNFSHAMNSKSSIMWYGAVGDGSTNCRFMLQKLQDALNPVSGAHQPRTVLFPAQNGFYYSDSTIVLHGINIVGEEARYSSVISFPASVVGFHLIGDSYGNDVNISHLGILATSKDANDGHVGGSSSNPKSFSPFDYHYHGVWVEAVVNFYDVTVESFSGHGIYINADVGLGTNSSLGNFYYVKSRNCYGSGLTIIGQDANLNRFHGLDIRSNNLYGVYDSSFLGNTYVSPHANGNFYGNYYFPRGGSHSVLMDAYGESGDAPNVFSGYTQVDGGLRENPETVTGTASVRDGIITNATAYVKPGTNDGISFNRDGSGGFNSAVQQFEHYSTPIWWRWFNNSFGLASWTMDWNSFIPDATNAYAQFGLINRNASVQRVIGSGYMSWGFKWMYVGDMFVQSQPSLSAKADIPYKTGDLVNNTSFDGTNPNSWKCIRSGQSGTYTEGLTAKTDGSNAVFLSGTTSVLRPGMTIVIAGLPGTITSFYGRGSADTLLTTGGWASATGQAISYQASVFKAQGVGYGTYSQKPTLTSDDYNWRFYSTDSSAWFTWLSSGWVKDVIRSEISSIVTNNIQVVNGLSSSTPGNIAIDTAGKRNRLAHKVGLYWFYEAISDSVSVLDNNALAYIDSLSANGYTPSNAEQLAINDFVLGEKSDGTWNDNTAIYPMIGGSSSTCAFNLKDPSSYKLTFNGGWTFSSSGADPNGSNGYANTGLNASTVFGNNLVHLTYYTSETTSGGLAIGSSNSGSSELTALNIAAFGQTYGVSGQYANRSFVTIGSVTPGIYMVDRVGTTDIQVYRNATSLNTNTTSDATAPQSLNIYLGADNENGTANYFDNKKCGYADVGVGINSTKVSSHNTRIQTLITALGR